MGIFNHSPGCIFVQKITGGEPPPHPFKGSCTFQKKKKKTTWEHHQLIQSALSQAQKVSWEGSLLTSCSNVSLQLLNGAETAWGAKGLRQTGKWDNAVEGFTGCEAFKWCLIYTVCMKFQCKHYQHFKPLCKHSLL